MMLDQQYDLDIWHYCMTLTLTSNDVPGMDGPIGLRLLLEWKRKWNVKGLNGVRGKNDKSSQKQQVPVDRQWKVSSALSESIR